MVLLVLLVVVQLLKAKPQQVVQVALFKQLLQEEVTLEVLAALVAAEAVAEVDSLVLLQALVAQAVLQETMVLMVQ